MASNLPEKHPQNARKTILIFGVNSFVGSNLAEFMKKDFRVIGTFHNHPVKIPGILTFPCDILSKEEVQFILYSFRPDVVIYSIGVSNLVKAHENEEYADALNTVGLFNVNEYCVRYKCKLIYISSGYVFGGEKKKYMEMDIPDPITIYGTTLASTEFYLQKSSLDYLIFRCCYLYGRSTRPLSNHWFEMLQKALKNNQNVKLDTFLHVGFLDIYYLAIILKLCIEQNTSNRLFQVSSDDIMPFLDFAKIYCKVFQESEGLISKGRWRFPISEMATIEYSGGELYYRMDISNIESYLNIELPSVEESLNFTFKRLRGQVTTKKGGHGINFI